MAKRYAYFFTRQDIDPEHQLVQTAHVSLELGSVIPKHEVPGLRFVNCGVPDEAALHDICHYLDGHDIFYVLYRDSFFNNEVTAIGVLPVSQAQREIFKFGRLLKFKS